MQPTFRQVPPSFFSRSISATFNPYCPARMAAVYPPGPPPMMTMSYIVSATASSLNTKHLFYATVPHTRISGFPVHIGGAGELHAAFLYESRTRRGVLCSEAGNADSALTTVLCHTERVRPHLA